jgi:hypothetical protein
MLDEKSKGKEIVIDKAPAPKHGQVIDIMEALKRSMERIPAKRNPPLLLQLRRKRRFRKVFCYLTPVSRAWRIETF